MKIILSNDILKKEQDHARYRLFDKFGPRVLVIPSAAILVLVMWMFTQIDLETGSGTL